jgi:hypothetical protein
MRVKRKFLSSVNLEPPIKNRKYIHRKDGSIHLTTTGWYLMIWKYKRRRSLYHYWRQIPLNSFVSGKKTTFTASRHIFICSQNINSQIFILIPSIVEISHFGFKIVIIVLNSVGQILNFHLIVS